MDFLKTLLIYMATTLAIAVQSTSTPGVPPEPTPTAPPQAVVSTATIPAATPTPEVTPGPEVGVTVEPTEAATPGQVPAITPNKAYHNLAVGAKGAEVRKLQERLIELGYLPEGSADGAYGRQTANAVRRFQYYNGLAQDGVAGRKTQTYLYENPDVMPYPGTAVNTTEAPTEELTEAPTEEPTEAPTEEPTEAPTEEPTEAPTEEPTEAPTEEPTEAPTEEPTEAPTEEPTEAPTEEPTEAPTEEPTEAPTEEPTEAPTEEPTEAPTEEPTEAPTEAPTEEPTEAPTEEPTEAPTEEPTEAPTEEPTEEPTEVPTEEPTEAPTEEPTEAPTEAPTPGPAEIEEEVDLDEEVEEIIGSVAMNDDGAPMEWIALEDGVPVAKTPRLQRKGGVIRVSLDDLAACLDSWELTDNGSALVLEANGYVLALFNEDAGLSATVDGVEIPVEEAEFGFVEEGHYISADFLARALNGTAQWDEEEKTLMLRLPSKETANASD